MRLDPWLTALAGAALAAAVTSAAEDVELEAGPAPVLLELFTSEGCSSCPPAEDVAAELLHDQPVAGARVLLLAWHVPYWDRLGWRDPYSTAAGAARHEAYAERLAHGETYTPQAFVDGRAQAVGSNRARLLQLVADASRLPKGAVAIRPAGDGQLSIEASWPGGGAAEVWAAAVIPRVESSVGAGENAGQRLTHLSVVRRAWRLGEGKGSFSAALARPATAGATNLVVWVQERTTGRILAAAALPGD